MKYDDKPRMTTLPPWAELARRALTHAAAERMDVAVRCVQRIAAEHGNNVIPDVLIAWVDTAWGRLFPDGLPDGYLDRPMRFWKVGQNTDTTEGIYDVAPNLRWAARFVFARLADDEAQGDALISSVETDAQWSANVSAMLDVCSANLRIALEKHQ